MRVGDIDDYHGYSSIAGFVVSPLNTVTGSRVVTVSFALAAGQLGFAPQSQALISGFGWVSACSGIVSLVGGVANGGTVKLPMDLVRRYRFGESGGGGESANT